MLGPRPALLRVASKIDGMSSRWKRETISRILAFEYPNRWAGLCEHSCIQFVRELEIAQRIPPVVMAKESRHLGRITVYER